MAKARVIKFCVRVQYIKSELSVDKAPLKRHGQGYRATYFKWRSASSSSSAVAEVLVQAYAYLATVVKQQFICILTGFSLCSVHDSNKIW